MCKAARLSPGLCWFKYKTFCILCVLIVDPEIVRPSLLRNVGLTWWTGQELQVLDSVPMQNLFMVALWALTGIGAWEHIRYIQSLWMQRYSGYGMAGSHSFPG